MSMEHVVMSSALCHPTNLLLQLTSNIPARGAGRLLRSAMQGRRWWSREKPLHSSVTWRPANTLYANNAEGDDDGKNRCYAENEVFR